MKLPSLVFLAGLTAVLLSACATKSDDPFACFQGQTAGQVYQSARTSIANGRYARAIKAYEALSVLYPFNHYSERAQLGLIYSYYQSGDSPAAKTAADHFIRLYPESPFVDYAYYMRALADMNQDRGWYLRYIPIDLSRRDLGTMRTAYQEFAQFVRQYPHSRYAADARQRMIYLRNLFASYELHIADYYFRKKAFVAAINRANAIVEQYQGAPEVERALIILIKSYRILGLEPLANRNLAILRLNFPNANFR